MFVRKERVAGEERTVFGDIVLVNFPFTNLEKTKQRPAAVISGERFLAIKNDLIIVGITSKISPVSELGEFTIKNWRAAGLVKPSMIKAAIATVEISQMKKKLGRLERADIAHLENMLKHLLPLG